MSGFARVQFKKDKTIFSAGDLADKLYVVEQGAIQLLDPRFSQPFARVAQGEAFGEQCFLSQGVRSATAVVLEDAEGIAISGEGFRKLLASQSPLVTSVFEALLLQLHMHNTLRRDA